MTSEHTFVGNTVCIGEFRATCASPFGYNLVGIFCVIYSQPFAGLATYSKPLIAEFLNHNYISLGHIWVC